MQKQNRPSDARPFFPIMAWDPAPGDAAALRKMKDCGLNIAGFAPPAKLDAIHRAGLLAIVSDPLICKYDWRKLDPAAARRNVARAIRKIGDHPAVFGYYLKDEPSAEEFAGLAVVAAEVRRLAPGKWPYINLFPNYASLPALGAASYPEHLERFIKTCRPPILSYDNYSLMEGGGLRHEYWSNLELMRAAARRHRIPFWNIVLSVAHFTYRELSAADARFQAFTTLAYGGRGLSYFTYRAPQSGNYRLAPLDQFGNPTPTWRHLQNVNLQLRNLAPTLVKLRSDEVYHFGELPGNSRGVSDRSLIQSAGEANLLVGDFTHNDGSRFALVVNKSFTRSTWCAFKYRTAPKQVAMVSPYTGQLVPFTGEQMVLAPGQGTLLKLGYPPPSTQNHKYANVSGSAVGRGARRVRGKRSTQK